MPVVHELFGETLTKSGAHRGAFRHARCPHMAGRQCDGGGNRNMVRWSRSDRLMASFFDDSVGSQDGYIPCGICSVTTDRNWAVCPRRLLTFDASSPSPQQKYLRDRVLHLAGFQSGERVKVWSEITVSFRDDTSYLRYRLDYVLKSEGKPPAIVEVMTSSTSGGDKRVRTDIKSAFCDALLYAEGNQSERGRSPAVNSRQVWARMASQMIVKSQVANRWGGCAIWVVQDAMMDYIRENTGIRLEDLGASDWEVGEVNVVSASIDDPNDIKLYTGPVVSDNGEACWVEILNTPAYPDVDLLEAKLANKEPVVDIRAP